MTYKKEPMIGITCAYDSDKNRCTINGAYITAVQRAGGFPVLLPLFCGEDQLERFAHMLDGVIFSGGGDVNPKYFGEAAHEKCGKPEPARDELEIPLIRMLRGLGKPILGICRGMQVMNIAFGGSIYQDIPSQLPNALDHGLSKVDFSLTHPTMVSESGLLARITGETNIQVNSIHHQSVKEVAPGFIVDAWSSDGVIEAIYSRDGAFALGVQYHPEKLYHTHAHARATFDAFIASARDGRSTK